MRKQGLKELIPRKKWTQRKKDRKEDNGSVTRPKTQRKEDSEESETDTGETQENLGLSMDNDLQDTSMEVDVESEIEGEGKRSTVNHPEWGADSASDQNTVTTEPTIPLTGTARLTSGVLSEEDDEEGEWISANPPIRGNKQRGSGRNNGNPRQGPSFTEFVNHPLQLEENSERK